MASFVFPHPDFYGQHVPAQPAPAGGAARNPAAGGDFVNLLLLADLALYDKPDDVRDRAGTLIERAEKIDDPALRRIVLFSLSKVVNAPENVAAVRREHLARVGAHFHELAAAARKGNRDADALAAVQIALKCDPANTEARLLFASLIEPKAALQTLHYGIKFLDLKSELAPAYFNRYFGALADLQQDRIAAKQALALLGSGTLPPAVRTVVANHAAMALFWIGDCADALRILDEEKLSETQQGLILKARCLFETRRTREAVALLSEKVNAFPAAKRDVILSQIARFQLSTGDVAAALDTTNRRISENPSAPQPYLQRLLLLERLGRTESRDAEIAAAFDAFSSQQSALLTLANFAAETGVPAVAETCVERASEKRFPPNVFVSALIEAFVTAGEPEKAILAYQNISKNSPKALEGCEAANSAILAAAYALAAKKNPDAASARTQAGHADLLLGQFLADASLSPENFAAVTQLFERVGETGLALRVAQAGLGAFPWHSQLRANVISLRIRLGAIDGNADRTPLAKEIRVLAAMRRPSPEIWSEIARWLDSGGTTLPPQEIAALKKLVAPLVRDDLQAHGTPRALD